jgi:hypothetical protein
MSVIGIGLNLLLAGLLAVALGMGWRLNRRLAVLRESHEGFTRAVHDLDVAAQRAEQGLADLRAATDEATDLLADRIEKARALAQKLEMLTARAPAAQSPAPQRMSAATVVRAQEPDLELDRPVDSSRLGALIGAARAASARPTPSPVPLRREPPPAPRPRVADDDLFDEPAGRMPISAMLGGRR